MKRVILIVMDGCGAGEAPDANEFGDFDHPATILHVWQNNPELKLPTLRGVGFLTACKVPLAPALSPQLSGVGFQYGRLMELSKGGKDSVTGHWEMAGIVTPQRFPTYPNGFPFDLVTQFESAIGSKILGNRAASGTEIIAEFGDRHLQTHSPILYTSADSVFQIACHVDVVPLDKLYEFCRIARDLLSPPNDVQRVIARPFRGNSQEGFVRTENRKDFPLPPPPNLCDKIGDVFGIGVVPELFAGRGFRSVRRTQNNAEHREMLLEALNSDARLIWANFEDFDMKYGHRNDVQGFGRCLEEFDPMLLDLLSRLQADDLLLLTADHGNDPTSPSTDHSREYVPLVAIAKGLATGSMPEASGMNQIAQMVSHHLGIES